MEIIKLRPRGFCYGVVNAINIVKTAINSDYPRPIYLLGQLVHNKYVNEYFENLGVIILHDQSKSRLELLDKIEQGTVVFSAHGVSDEVRIKAVNKKLHIVDASCKDVLKSQTFIKEIAQVSKVLYIGKKNHPESEAVSNIENVFVVYDTSCISKFQSDNITYYVTNQTTMSKLDIKPILDELDNLNISYKYIDEICNATTVRQLQVINQDKDNELCIVVGDVNSNNTAKLSLLSENIGVKSIRIENLNDLTEIDLTLYNKISITSGTSTPSTITEEVINYLEGATSECKSKITVDNIL